MHISQQDHPPDILGPILKPFTSLIIQIDKEVIFFILLELTRSVTAFIKWCDITVFLNRCATTQKCANKFL